MNRKRYIPALLIIACISAIALSLKHTSAKKPQMPKNFSALLSLTEDQLQSLDLACVNLLCAQDLNGSEQLNISNTLKTLDQWADLVKQNEKKYAPGFYANREKYDGSYEKFRAVNLGLTLKNDLHCGYNAELVSSGAMDDIQDMRFFKNSKDLFLHGFIEQRTGSCSSLPVLMTAVGRRCGYPLYLVTCKGHLFCRWDDGKQRFNIETACPGVDTQLDESYKQWPHPATEEEIESEGYLKNLTSLEELGVFCDLRGANLQANGRFSEALEAYNAALKAFPESKYIRASIRFCERQLKISPQPTEEI